MVRAVASKRHDGCAGVTFGSAVGGRSFDALLVEGSTRTALIHYGCCPGRCTRALRAGLRILHAFRHALLFAPAKGLVSSPFSPLTSKACALVYFQFNPVFQFSHSKLSEAQRLTMAGYFGFVRTIFERLSKFWK